MRICIDVDGVLLPDVRGEGGPDAYYKREPYPLAVETVQRLHAKGFRIIIHTARGMKTCNDDMDKAAELHKDRLTKWLVDNKIPFHEIHWKPRADFYLDDKALNVHGYNFGSWKIVNLVIG